MLSNIDNAIIDSINSKIANNLEYFSYGDVTKKEGIHSYARYPATMVPEMQKDILQFICEHAKVKKVLDPFMGSGTVLTESVLLGLDVFGLDINPYAYFLTKSKLNFIPIPDLIKAKETLFQNLDLNYGESLDIHNFRNIDKWFRADYQYSLSFIKQQINKCSDSNIKLFFLIAFSDIVTSLKNSKSSTFKLHMKTQADIDTFNKNSIQEFKNKVVSNLNNYQVFIANAIKNQKFKHGFKSKIKIACNDSKHLKKALNLRKNSIDLIITSPPYGDNHTTVTYGQYSSLPLLWMNDSSLETEYNTDLLSNFNAIDTASLGGKKYTIDFITKSNILTRSTSLNDFYLLMLKNNQIDKARKVVSFIIDFEKVLKDMHTVLKTDCYLVFVVGNRRVHNELVPFDDITSELLNSNFEKIIDFNRLIKNKKMASMISSVDNKPVKSMDTETILIFKKK